MGTRFLLSSDVQDTLRHLPPSTKKAIKAGLNALKASWPRAGGLDVTALDTEDRRGPSFRLRIGNWRVVFRARSDVLEIVRIFHRREGYGWLERL